MSREPKGIGPNRGRKHGPGTPGYYPPFAPESENGRRRVRDTSRTQKRIVDTGPILPRVDSESVSAAGVCPDCTPTSPAYLGDGPIEPILERIRDAVRHKPSLMNRLAWFAGTLANAAYESEEQP